MPNFHLEGIDGAELEPGIPPEEGLQHSLIAQDQLLLLALVPAPLHNEADQVGDEGIDEGGVL